MPHPQPKPSPKSKPGSDRVSTPGGKRTQRRVDPDKAPWNTLPVIVFHPDERPAGTTNAPVPESRYDYDFDPADIDFSAQDAPAVITDGTIVVARGDFDVASLPARCLWEMEKHPGEEYVVEADGLGRIEVARRGVLVDAELATRVAHTGYLMPLKAPDALRADDLTDYVRLLREHAARTLEVADTYERLVADGWDFAPTPPPGAWWPPLRRDMALGD